jgi:DNA-binding LytR/AlgR family response regulator
MLPLPTGGPLNRMPTALIAEDEPLLAAACRPTWPRCGPSCSCCRCRATAAAHWRPRWRCGRTCLLSSTSACPAQRAGSRCRRWPRTGPTAAPFPLLVFVTAYDQYALQAFEAQAVDYLVKPVQRERLAACVQRLQARLAARAPHPGGARLEATAAAGPAARAAGHVAAPAPPRLEVIQAQVGNLVHLVPVDEVLYFEAADKYVRVVTAEREHLIRLSLRELLPQLDPQQFWQVHRGTVVQARCHHQRPARGVGQGHADAARAGPRRWWPAGCTRTCSRACSESLSDRSSNLRPTCVRLEG